MSDEKDEKDEDNDEEKRLIQADRSRAAASTTERSDGKNFYCPICGRYFYTPDERNNHGCSIIQYKSDN